MSESTLGGKLGTDAAARPTAPSTGSVPAETMPTPTVAAPPDRAVSPSGPWAPLLRLYPSLGNPAFRLLWLGMLPGPLAWQMSVVAAPYAAFVLAGSATVLGVVSLATGLPMLVLSLVGGVVADRVPRRRVLFATQGVLGASAAAVAVLALFGRLEVWHLVALGAAQGTAFSFNMPARMAYTAEIVERPLLGNAVALNNAGVNFCRIAGPSLAGALLSTPEVGVGGVFVVMALMYGVVIAALVRLSRRPPPTVQGAMPPERGGRARASGWAQLLEGLDYIRSSPTLLALLGMVFLAVLFGMPYQTLMPLFAERVFGVGAGGLGTLMAASGLGALAGSLAVAALSGRPAPARLQLAFGVGFGLALVGFGLAPSFPLALVALALVGAFSSAFISLNNTLIISSTEPRLHGRVMSVALLTFAAMPIGAFPMAWLAEQIGGRPVVAVAGAVVAASVLGITLLSPASRGVR